MPRETTALLVGDEELARRAQEGCVASFEELARRYQVPLLRFLRRRADPEEAEDLTQDTLIRAYENLHRYRPAWRFSTWLFTIGRRLSINQQRRQRPQASREALESLESAAAEPLQIATEKEERRRLWELAAEVLSEQQNTALWLYYVEEMPVKEIARVLGRSRVAVKAVLFRARKKLLPILQEMKPYASAKDRGKTHVTSPRQTATELNHG